MEFPAEHFGPRHAAFPGSAAPARTIAPAPTPTDASLGHDAAGQASSSRPNLTQWGNGVVTHVVEGRSTKYNVDIKSTRIGEWEKPKGTRLIDVRDGMYICQRVRGQQVEIGKPQPFDEEDRAVLHRARSTRPLDAAPVRSLYHAQEARAAQRTPAPKPKAAPATRQTAEPEPKFGYVEPEQVAAERISGAKQAARDLPRFGLATHIKTVTADIAEQLGAHSQTTDFTKRRLIQMNIGKLHILRAVQLGGRAAASDTEIAAHIEALSQRTLLQERYPIGHQLQFSYGFDLVKKLGAGK